MNVLVKKQWGWGGHFYQNKSRRGKICELHDAQLDCVAFLLPGRYCNVPCIYRTVSVYTLKSTLNTRIILHYKQSGKLSQEVMTKFKRIDKSHLFIMHAFFNLILDMTLWTQPFHRVNGLNEPLSLTFLYWFQTAVRYSLRDTLTIFSPFSFFFSDFC